MADAPTLLAGALVGAAVWRVGVIAAVLSGRAGLPRVGEAPAPRETPLVSILVPARNEERNIGTCLASLSLQTYPQLEIVVVDDDSRDRTPEIVAAAARRDGRIRMLTLAGPPPGWTGKNFALASGV